MSLENEKAGCEEDKKDDDKAEDAALEPVVGENEKLGAEEAELVDDALGKEAIVGEEAEPEEVVEEAKNPETVPVEIADDEIGDANEGAEATDPEPVIAEVPNEGKEGTVAAETEDETLNAEEDELKRLDENGDVVAEAVLPKPLAGETADVPKGLDAAVDPNCPPEEPEPEAEAKPEPNMSVDP